METELKTLGIEHDSSATYDDTGKAVPGAAEEISHSHEKSNRIEEEMREEELKHRYCKKGHKGPVDACPLAKKWSDPKAWPNGKVPVMGADVDLTIPVDSAIVLDMPNIQSTPLVCARCSCCG